MLTSKQSKNVKQKITTRTTATYQLFQKNFLKKIFESISSVKLKLKEIKKMTNIIIIKKIKTKMMPYKGWTDLLSRLLDHGLGFEFLVGEGPRPGIEVPPRGCHR